jgi:hypothetical protein
MASRLLKKPAKIVIASVAKQSRKPMKSTAVWIATPGFALLAMTAQGFFSSLLAGRDIWAALKVGLHRLEGA